MVDSALGVPLLYSIDTSALIHHGLRFIYQCDSRLSGHTLTILFIAEE